MCEVPWYLFVNADQESKTSFGDCHFLLGLCKTQRFADVPGTNLGRAGTYLGRDGLSKNRGLRVPVRECRPGKQDAPWRSPLPCAAIVFEG